MFDGFVPVVALIGMTATALIFAVEVRRWRTGGPATGRGHRILRTTIVILIETLFLMILLGPAVVGARDPVSTLIYWTLCLALGIAVIILALVDFRGVLEQFRRLHRDVFHDTDSSRHER